MSNSLEGKTVRIGVIGPAKPDDFADNIVYALQDMGVEAFALGPAQTGVQQRHIAAGLTIARRALLALDHRMQHRVQRKSVELELDVVISVDKTLLPQIVAGIRRSGTKVCLWFPDHVGNLDRQLMFLAPYDALFVKEPMLVDRATRILGLPVHYLPEACNPSWHTPPAGVEPEPHIAVAGYVNGARARLLSRLLDAEIPLRIYGPPIPSWVPDNRLGAAHTSRYVRRIEKAVAFRRASAVLNNLNQGEIEGVNCRLFEAAGCGAAVLCEFRPVLTDLFDTDREIVSFATFHELVEKAGKLLANADRSRSIGDAASRKAHARHTYQHRLIHLLSVVT